MLMAKNETKFLQNVLNDLILAIKDDDPCSIKHYTQIKCGVEVTPEVELFQFI